MTMSYDYMVYLTFSTEVFSPFTLVLIFVSERTSATIARNDPLPFAYVHPVMLTSILRGERGAVRSKPILLIHCSVAEYHVHRHSTG